MKKIIIVTGSAQGIGRGIADYFLREGASVVISDLKQNDCDKVVKEFSGNYSGKVIGIKCDVSKRSDVQDLIKKTVNKFGRLDVFVNNAGIYPSKPFMKLSDKDWQLVQDVNLKGSFYSVQESAKVMKNGGKIIIISSIASLVGFGGLAHYCASKSGVNGLVRAAALELASKGITVNAVAPGAIETPTVKKNMSNGSLEGLKKTIPLGRIGKPEDIAHAVAFLASDRSSYITGQIVPVDGGWTIQ